MDLSARILGTATATKLGERASAALLTIGRDVFTRRDLAKWDCYNFGAAANLSAILNRELQVRDTRFVFEQVPPSALALPRLGAISLAVLGACFQAKKLGGASPLEAWVRRHAAADQATGTDGLVSFHTLKHRHAAEVAAERATITARTRARRTQAHRTRVQRFTTRHEDTTT